MSESPVFAKTTSIIPKTLAEIVSPISTTQPCDFSTRTSVESTPASHTEHISFKLMPYFPRKLRRLLPKLSKWSNDYTETQEPPVIVLSHVLLSAFMLEEMVEGQSMDPSMLSVCSYLISRSAVPVATLTHAVLLTERATRRLSPDVALQRFELVAIFCVALICSSQLLEDRPLKHIAWAKIMEPLGISHDIIKSYSRQFYKIVQWRFFISESKYVNACRIAWRRLLATTEWREVLFQIFMQSGTIEPCKTHEIGSLWVILEWKPQRPVKPIRAPHMEEDLLFSGVDAQSWPPREEGECSTLTDEEIVSEDFDPTLSETDEEKDDFNPDISPSPLLEAGDLSETDESDESISEIETVFSPFSDTIRGLPELVFPGEDDGKEAGEPKLPVIPSSTLRFF